MRLASYQNGGRASFGIVTDRGLVDVPKRLPKLPDLLTALDTAGGLDMVRALSGEKADWQLSDVALLPVIPKPEKIIGIGLNYRDHAAELGSQLPDRPTVFVRWPLSMVGHLNPLVRPRSSTWYDYEGELAVIFGRPARYVNKADALTYVAGYTIANDGSIRDWQRHTAQFTAGKNFPNTGSLGPWLVTADELPDPGHLPVRTKINGQLLQDGNTANMVFGVPELIEYASTFTQIKAGDVMITGTPAGVGAGRKPPLWMKAGDLVEVEIPGIGILRNPVVDEG